MSSLLVFNRVYRLEIYSQVGIFDPSCELAQLLLGRVGDQGPQTDRHCRQVPLLVNFLNADI
jgi:hypothetical protein